MMALVESQTYCGCEYYCDDYWCDYCEWCGKEGAVKTPTLRFPAPVGPKPAAPAVAKEPCKVRLNWKAEVVSKPPLYSAQLTVDLAACLFSQ